MPKLRSRPATNDDRSRRSKCATTGVGSARSSAQECAGRHAGEKPHVTGHLRQVVTGEVLGLMQYSVSAEDVWHEQQHRPTRLEGPEPKIPQARGRTLGRLQVADPREELRASERKREHPGTGDGNRKQALRTGADPRGTCSAAHPPQRARARRPMPRPPSSAARPPRAQDRRRIQ